MSELLKNDKYEIRCTSGDATQVILEIIIRDEKLTEKEMASLVKTIRKIVYAFDRVDSVSSRYGSTGNGKKEVK